MISIKKWTVADSGFDILHLLLEVISEKLIQFTITLLACAMFSRSGRFASSSWDSVPLHYAQSRDQPEHLGEKNLCITPCKQLPGSCFFIFLRAEEAGHKHYKN